MEFVLNLEFLRLEIILSFIEKLLNSILIEEEQFLLY